MEEAFQMQPFTPFLRADETDARHFVTGQKARRNVTQRARRCKGQPRAFAGRERDVSATKDVDLFDDGIDWLP